MAGFRGGAFPSSVDWGIDHAVHEAREEGNIHRLARTDAEITAAVVLDERRCRLDKGHRLLVLQRLSMEKGREPSAQCSGAFSGPSQCRRCKQQIRS